jgi:hypothetical protein
MGEVKIRLRELPGTPAFGAEYAAARAGAKASRERDDRQAFARPKSGTLRWLCVTYFRSAEFKLLNPSNQQARRRILENFLEEPIAPGACQIFADFPIRRVTAKALRVLCDRKAHLPEAAIGRVKALRRLFLWALDNDFIQQDPSRDVRRLAHTSHGYHTSTLEEVEQYEARHPIGSKAGLALATLERDGQTLYCSDVSA